MNESEFKKSALLAIETLRARLRALEQSNRQDIAIVGMAARVPGAPHAEAFWALLEEGRESVTAIPADRWDANAFYDVDPDAPGKMYTRRAGFIDEVSGFDAHFFGISPREAMYMDPQHRIMLETAWHALEHAGLAPSELSGTRTGVFMGLSTHEYLGLLIRHMSYDAIDMYLGTGTSPAAGVGRISYRLGFEGPAVTIDTACSSSLVAIHQACQALRARECDLALAGGVNVILNPSPMITMSRARLAAPDGRCKTFDAAADGYVRGEGCGVVVLKRLGDAERDGDPIRAVVRGSAVNQDGASGGLTVPNGRAQQRVIADALQQAGLEPGDVDYLEAHGTGTSLGDPIEVQAAAAVLGVGRRPDRPLWIGSVKTNIGHLEAAAGVVGVIKVVMALEHQAIPKHLHFTTPSPHVPWSKLPVRVAREAQPWPRTDERRVAGVSSFGFSGTNAHVVIEEGPAPSEPATAQRETPLEARRYHLLTLSARTPDALRALVGRYQEWLDAHPEAEIADVCYSAAVGRSHLEERAALVVESRDQARRMLSAVADDRPVPGAFAGVCSDPPKTAWLFTGQGSQYPGMGRELFTTQPVFRQTLEQCQEVLRGRLDRPLLDVMFGEETLLGHTSYAQPALFALEMALARLWQHWGLEPDVLVGHSVGQYAAACVAGVFSLEDGLRLLAERGQLMGALPAGGRMAAVFAGARDIEGRLGAYPRLSVAAYNGAHQVVSGPADEVQAFVARFEQDGVRCEVLDTSHAFHSVLMEPALDAFETAARALSYRPAERTLICNRTGKVLTRQAVLDAAYWRRHARQPVQFAASVETLGQLGCKVLLEIGPQPVLSATALRAWPDGREAPRAVPSLRREVPGSRQIVEALARLYVAGSRPNFRAFDAPWRRRKLDLPRYPFEHRRFWFEAPSTPAVDGPAAGAPVGAGGSIEESSRIAPAQPTVSASAAVGAPAAQADAWLAAIEPAEREARIAEFLRAELGRALGVAASDIDADAPFATLGVDSLMATELRNRVQAALGRPIPATTFIVTHPSVAGLARGLLDLWTETRANPARQDVIRRVPRDGALQLSHAQEQLWFLQQLLPSSSAYNIAVRVRIRGPLDSSTLAATFDAIVERHEVLRTTFRSEMGVPKAVVAPAAHVDLPVHDVGDEADIAAWEGRDGGAPFDLAAGPLFRARLLRVGDADHVLLVTMHHIITDGWSFRVLLHELSELYRAFHRGEPSSLPELAIQYADYAAWQREWLQGDTLESLLDYWKRDLAGAPPLALATDRPRPPRPTFRGARVRFELGLNRTAALHALCREENVTLSVPLMAAFAALLQRYSGQDDFVIGTLSANRTRLEVEGLIGFFVTALPLRLRLDGDPDVRELLSRIRGRLVDAIAHQDAPFDLVVNAVERHRDASRNPLFQVQLILQAAVAGAGLEGLEIDASEIDMQTAKRDLTLTLFNDGTLSGHVEYATDLFEPVRIERLLRHFEVVIDAMTLDRTLRLSSLPLLTEFEQGLHAKRVGPRPTGARTIQQVFERAVDRTPDRVAVTTGTGTLTYRQLDEASNRLARWLRRRGVGPETAVAVEVGRSIEMPIGFLGVLKAGGIYVPVDPSYPRDRIDYLLADARAALHVTAVESPDIALESAERLEDRSAPEHAAYLIYTSGSTGRPKGVVVSHGSVVEYAETLGRELGIGPSDVYLHTASISFSSSIRQLVVPLAAGATIAIANVDERRDPLALLERIRASQVTVADLVPTVVRQLVDAVAALGQSERLRLLDNRLRLLLTASEPLRFGLVRDWRAHIGAGVAWINMYGQTETAGIVSVYRVPEAIAADHRNGIVPIGRPRGNVAMLVLDRERRPVPCGVAGDLYIAGDALAQGYAGDRMLTAERFFPHGPSGGERLYASGDIVRLAWDGTIEFVGRADQQVKIRGLRVEPAEIERVLLEHGSVREAVVLASDDGAEGKRLVAYVATHGAPLSIAALRAHARQKLPDHMVPSAFVTLERLPLTPNGKVDLTALPEAEPARDEEIEFVPPRPGFEESLADIWRQVLRVDRVGAGDNFFSLGGHSLLAAQVRSRIQSTLGIDLPLAALFEDQTLSALALRVEASAGPARHRARPPLVRVPRRDTMPASYAQELMWEAEKAEPGSPGHWIDVGLRIRGPLDVGQLVRSVHAAVERHELLRTIYRAEGGSLSQVVLEAFEPDVRVVAPSGVGGHAGSEANALDLTTRPPVRAEVVRSGDDEHTLNVFVHRILCDGFATRLLLGEIGALYMNAAAGTAHFPLLDGSIQYADYAAWERTWLTPDALVPEVDFFRRELAGAGAAFVLPADHPRPPRRLRRGARRRFELPRDLVDVARTTAVREQASLYTVLLAAFASALGRHAGQPEVVVGSPVSRRSQPGTEQIIGPFMNMVPLRIDRSHDANLSALVRHVKDVLLTALAHQDVPFHYVAATLAAEHGRAASGVGEVAFVMGDPAPQELVVGDLSLARVESTRLTARRELTLSVIVGNGEISGTLTYDVDLFNPEAIDRMVEGFQAALASARD